MHYITLSENEISEIKKLHESLLSKSSHGIFYSIGKIIGENIAKEIASNQLSDWGKFSDEASRILKERGFVEQISFEEKKVTVKGSIEVTNSQSMTCDILRGIISALHKAYFKSVIYCEETSCESMGAGNCVFEIHSEVVI